MTSNRKRRGKGEGSLYFDERSQKWIANVSYIDNQGRRCRKALSAKTKTEAQKRLQELNAKYKSGIIRESASKLTVEQWLTEWLDEVVKRHRRPGTYVGYEVIVRRYLIPYFGRIPLRDLQVSMVNKIMNQMEDDQLPRRQRELALAVLRSALSTAEEWEFIPKNPARRLRRKKGSPPARRYALSLEQVRLLLEAATEDRFYALYVLAITTGLRKGELLGLKWEDIDFEHQRLIVNRTLLDHSGKISEGPPKSEKSRRMVPLTKSAIEALKEHRIQSADEGHPINTGYIFCDTKGGPMRPGNLDRRSFKPLLARAGLEDIPFHTLRHTATTIYFQQGVQDKIIQDIMGHSTLKMTMDIYTHVPNTMLDQAAAKMDEFLNPPESL